MKWQVDGMVSGKRQIDEKVSQWSVKWMKTQLAKSVNHANEISRW